MSATRKAQDEGRGQGDAGSTGFSLGLLELFEQVTLTAAQVETGLEGWNVAPVQVLTAEPVAHLSPNQRYNRVLLGRDTAKRYAQATRRRSGGGRGRLAHALTRQHDFALFVLWLEERGVRSPIKAAENLWFKSGVKPPDRSKSMPALREVRRWMLASPLELLVVPIFQYYELRRELVPVARGRQLSWSHRRN